MATRNGRDELQCFHKGENQDDNVENWHRKFSDTDVNDDGEDRSTAHFTARVVLFLAHFITPSHWLKFDLHAIHGCLSLIRLTPLSTSQPSSCPSSFSPFFHLSDDQQQEFNKNIMKNLCESANNGSEGTYDVLHFSTFVVRIFVS